MKEGGWRMSEKYYLQLIIRYIVNIKTFKEMGEDKYDDNNWNLLERKKERKKRK